MSTDTHLDFGETCRRYRTTVSRFVSSLVRPSEFGDIEDLVQVVFLRAWRAWPTFAGTAQEQVRALLFTIARRAVADHYRYGAAAQRCERPTDPDAPVFAAGHSADHADRVCELLDLATSIAADERAAHAMQLRVVQQLRWRQIGVRLRCADQTAQELVARATDGSVGKAVAR